MNNMPASTTADLFYGLATIDLGSYTIATVIAASLTGSVILLSGYRKNNSQGDAEAEDRWDNEIFSRAIIPLYLSLERSIIDVIAEEETPSFGAEMLETKRNVLVRTGIQNYSGVTEFHDALDEIYSKKARLRELKDRHNSNRKYLFAVGILSLIELVAVVILIAFPGLAIVPVLICVGVFLLATVVLWALYWRNRFYIDNLQYGDD